MTNPSAIADEPASPHELAATLRRELAGHNLRVVLLSVLAAVTSVILWVAFYAVAYWLTLLFITAVKGSDSAVPGPFRAVFLAVAGFLLAFTWIDHRLHPDDRPRDKRSTGEIVLDFVLVIPRVTLSVWTTLTAWQTLTDREIERAGRLLAQLEAERRIRLQTMPIEIPSENARTRILYALQLTQFIDIRREDHEYWVILNPLRPSTPPLADAKLPQ